MTYKMKCPRCKSDMKYIEDKEAEKLGWIQFDCPNGCENGYIVPNTVIQALDKQTPRKPNYPDIDKTAYCPICTMIVDDLYCSTCGQKIDWD